MRQCDVNFRFDQRARAKDRLAEFRDDESGSFIVFCLFLFVTILFMGGMAVDLMRLDTRRVEAQNTLDGAILAASSLSQKEDAETLVKDHFAKAGFNPDEVTVKGTPDLVNDTILVGRTVQAKTNLSIDTFFMNLLGIDELESGVQGTAREAVQNVEISLILDISGSMGDNDRLKNLKVAAKNFITKVYTNSPPGSLTSISIIPYNGTVVVGESLLKHLNANGSNVPVDTPAPYVGALTDYPTQHNSSTCVRFEEDEFKERAISETTPLNRVSHFDPGSNNFNQPSMSKRWCNENRAAILVHETDPEVLKKKIDSLTDGGWTGIDNGMKWGVALLDPAIEPALAAMIADGDLKNDVAGRPATYDREKTMKVVILMTDGENTLERDLAEEYKRGPTRVWFSSSSTTGFDAALGRDRTEFDGYYVLMPENGTDTRFYVPGDPTTTDDDVYVSDTSLPSDALQQTYQTLHKRFAEDDIASFFFKHSDTVAYNAHRGAAIDTVTYGEIDTRLQSSCDAARDASRIRVFAISFEAPDAGVKAMKNCAKLEGNYFDVNGKGINAAFDSIAGQISMLRLKE